MERLPKWKVRMRSLANVCDGDGGQAATEYIVILSLLVLGIGGLSLTALGGTLGTALTDAIGRVATALSSAT